MWIKRSISEKIEVLASQRPAILLTGARQTGKTSLLHHLFPKAQYVNFDIPSTAERAESHPQDFLKSFNSPVILDEIQYVPSLFRYLKAQIDENRSLNGQWLLTGSQKFSLMKEVSESLAGRISIIELETLSLSEIANAQFKSSDYFLRGGYPELWQKPLLDKNQFFDDYLVTYLQRDLKQILEVSDLRAFNRFLRSVSLRSSQLVNFTDLSRDAGVTSPTGKRWFEVLHTSNICGVLEPYFNNHLKRLVKSPKIYFKDIGFLSYLFNIHSWDSLQTSPYAGAFFENFVYRELITQLAFAKEKSNLFFLRDKNNLEVDFLIEQGAKIHLIEAKASERVNSRLINLNKAEALLKTNYQVTKTVACLTKEPKPFSKDGITYVNPLLHSDWLPE